MENSPLTLAHSHARNALLETRRSNPVAASEEHDLAAVEFATAAQGTTDSEALRILHLLEQHHKKLGQILKFRHENPLLPQTEARSSVSKASITATPVPRHDSPPASNVSAPTPSLESVPQPPRLSHKPRATARDLSSSIASNLATARGIPGTQQRRGPPISPTLSAQNVGAKIAREQARSSAAGETGKVTEKNDQDERPSKPSWAPPLHPPATESYVSSQEQNAEAVPITSYDAPFQHFYNTFESLISKISAPLAFAGLPLNTTQPPIPTITADAANQSASKTKAKVTSNHVPNAADSIDYSQLISRAALRAVRDGSSNPAAESFYVVPTTGGTISYAEIMSRDERHRRHLPNISEDTSNDDFVDARESVPEASSALLHDKSPSLRKKITRSGGKAAVSAATLSKDTVTVGGKTMEELAMENEALKHLSDTLSKRLHVFEVSAQSSSAALAQSIRSLQRSPLVTPENSAKRRQDSITSHNSSNRKRSDPTEAQARIAELEDILKKNEKELARREKENAKLKDVVVRYREKWEKLKEGARARREGGGEKPPKKGVEDDATGIGDQDAAGVSSGGGIP